MYTFVVSPAFMAGAASQAGDADSPGTWSHLRFAGVRECPPWCSIVGATVTVHPFLCNLHSYILLYGDEYIDVDSKFLPCLLQYSDGIAEDHLKIKVSKFPSLCRNL